MHNTAGVWVTSRSVYVRVALDTPLRRTFDYLPSAGASLPAIGARTWVPFGRQKRVGLVVDHVHETDASPEKLKPVGEPLDAEAILDTRLLSLLLWAADYYHHPVGEVLFTALPKRLRDGAASRLVRTVWELTAAGREAVARGEPRRAPRQRELLAALSVAPQGLDEDALHAAWPAWRDAARALLRQEWISSRTDSSDLQVEAPTSEARRSPHVLEPEQATAVDSITAKLDRFGAFLVQGITGSGKTEVYLRVVERVLELGRTALILVPEIGLTPQLLSRFAARFDVPIAALHSGLTDSERLAAWRDAYEGRARIVLGTRSAVFAPLQSLGIVVVDEEHDASFKQHEGGFRYSARDLAVVRAQRAGVPVVLGSATPALESLQNVVMGRYERLSLPRRAGEAVPPQLALVDLRTQAMRHGLSTFVVTAMQRHLDASGQILVYINRRGYAPTLACTACGWIAGCHSCDARLTVHRGSQRLKCHHCGADEPLPTRCKQCGHDVQPVGQGTERIEEALAGMFPSAPLARLDRDTARDGDELESVVRRVASGEARILVGTQMITKGHDFPDVTLAVVLNADQGLFSTDFRAAERLAQTIVQVAGRAGRGERRGEVLIQTEYPEHPLLRSLLVDGYEGFALTALAEREAAEWPPFSRLAALRSSAATLQEATAFLSEARAALRPPPTVKLLGPAPAAMTKRAARFHAHLLVESSDRASLHRFLQEWLPLAEALPSARRVRWALDVDPLELF